MITAVDATSPLDISWEVIGGYGAQAFYRFQFATANNFSASYLICDSGVVASSASLCVPACNELSHGAFRFATAHWRVALMQADGVFSSWTVGSPFVLGGGAADFAARFIAAPAAAVAKCAPVRMRAVTKPLGAALTANITQVTAFVSSPGYVQVWSGGSRVDERHAWGSWPEFRTRVYYIALDVTDHFLAPGADLTGVPFGFRMGGGAYCAQQFAASYNATAVPLLFELRITFTSGAAIVIAAGSTDLPVRVHSDTIVQYDWYTGETVFNDLSVALNGWDSINFNANGWAFSESYENLDGVELTPSLEHPVKTFMPIKAVGFSDLGAGNYSWTFPLNFAGIVEITVNAVGYTNSTVTLSGGEETDGKGGVICQLHVCMAVSWRLAGNAAEVITNSFSFFGAQHFQLSGWPQGMPPPTIDSAVSIPTSTLIPDKVALTLDFGSTAESQDALNTTILAAVQSAAQWGQQSNFQSLPSDCPNREKCVATTAQPRTRTRHTSTPYPPPPPPSLATHIDPPTGVGGWGTAASVLGRRRRISTCLRRIDRGF